MNLRSIVKHSPSLAVLVALGLLANPLQASPPDEYWDKLKQLCGQAFEGQLVASPDGDLENQRLLMHVRSCSDEEIQIPFAVGHNLSRTWVLRRVDDRIELKHDHRLRDGTPEATTLYGGTSPNPGSPNAQIFPADALTVAQLPDNYPNVWVMEVHPGDRFVYYVRRLLTDRHYHVEFDLSAPVDPPPTPWGAED